MTSGATNSWALSLDAGALVMMLLFHRLAPRFPGILVAVAGTMVAVSLFDLALRAWTLSAGSLKACRA